MIKLTKPLESATRKKTDSWLKKLDWSVDEEDVNCNVFTERAKTEAQAKKLKGKQPDYVLYRYNSDEPIAVIEAKRKGQSLDDALQQGVELYAKPLKINIVFAIDGSSVKSFELREGRELTIDNEPLRELISEEKLLRFIKEGTNIEEVTEEVKYTREELIKIFKWADDLLRAEGIQKGIERFTAFSNILFIKIISEIENDREKRKIKRQLKKSLCWESFCDMNDEDAMLNYINDTVLKNGLAKEYNHSDDIFQEKLKIKSPKTVKEIVNKLSRLKLINTESDVKGDAFEYFIKTTASANNDLGEYFTPRHIVKLMTYLINPKFGNKILDPFCGTGGFLIQSFKHIKKIIDERDAKLMNELKQNCLFGVELTETYKVAKMNMIITGDGHNNIIQDDTARNKFLDKYLEAEKDKEKIKRAEILKENGFDIIISNIPYNQKTIYGGLYPVVSNNGDSIFIQSIIKNLAKNGKIAVIVPEGLIFRKLYEKTRIWCLENANLSSVISLPHGIFLPYANVKTAIFIFEGKKATKKVWFYKLRYDGFELNTNRRLSLDNDIPDLINKWKDKPISENSFWVDYKRIKHNRCSLNIDEYIPKRETTSKYPLISIEDVCAQIKAGGTPSRNKVEFFRGKNLWITITDMKQKYICNSKEKITNEAIRNSNAKFLPKGTVLISIFATLGEVSILKKEATTNQAIAGLMPDQSKIDTEYLYYILKSKKSYIESLGRGIAQKNINLSILKDIKIPLPPLSIQKRIVKNLQDKDKNIKNLNMRAMKLREENINFLESI